MIPKTIHYCWFGRGKKSKLIKKCIKSWKKYLPEWEIKEWNEDNFDINCNDFVRDAYKAKKWAFVADYCRFYILHKYGGVYLDTDVEILRPLDNFLNNTFFIGTELIEDESTRIDAATFGSVKGHWFLKECLDYYNTKSFSEQSFTVSSLVVEQVASSILEKHGYTHLNQNHSVLDINIYSSDFFTNISSRKNNIDYYTLHHFEGSWIDTSNRGIIFHFCKKLRFKKLYNLLEKTRLKLRL